MTGMLHVGSMVKLEEHDTDQYGRTVAEVFRVKKPKIVGLEMVKKGYVEIHNKHSYQHDEDKLMKFKNRSRKRDKGRWDANGLASAFSEKKQLLSRRVLSMQKKRSSGSYGYGNIISTSGLYRFKGHGLFSSKQSSTSIQWQQQEHQCLDTGYQGGYCESPID